MRIDISYPSATASSANEQQPVGGTRHKMEPQDGTSAIQSQPGGPTARVSATVGISRTAGVSDTADISGVVPSISDLASAVHSAADVRHAKVQSLREAMDQGTYQVSPERIAESMLAQATSKLR